MLRFIYLTLDTSTNNMTNTISKIPNNFQNRDSVAWQKLCEYVELIAKNGSDEFVPKEYLGDELFSQIYTLPKSISKLKRVKKIGLYGSNLKRIPPEIGEMESLEYFDPYGSYDLNWLPYEITNCKNLKDSRISTRALYGNYKNRKGFPRLNHNPVKYTSDIINCSICKREMSFIDNSQYWITLGVATDIVPLLVNVCSDSCKKSLPKPPEDYVQHPHRGGSDLKQPDMDEWDYIEKNYKKVTISDEPKEEKKNSPGKLPIIKLIRKIWEK